jgi:hypothetical protein
MMSKAKCLINMANYAQNMLEGFPESQVEKAPKTPWNENLFKVESKSVELSDSEQAQGLFLCKHTCPGISPEIAFLTTWVQHPTQRMWDSELEHWKLRNGDKYSHMIAETDGKKREHLLATAKQLLQTRHKLPPRYRKMFPAYSKLTKKHTKNLKTWVNMMQQTVHYLLNV